VTAGSQWTEPDKDGEVQLAPSLVGGDHFALGYSVGQGETCPVAE
jgi:hypothetical protein